MSGSRGEILSGETIQSIVSVSAWDGEGLNGTNWSRRQAEQEAENKVTSPAEIREGEGGSVLCSETHQFRRLEHGIHAELEREEMESLLGRVASNKLLLRKEE
jgi:hypothetical protein